MTDLSSIKLNQKQKQCVSADESNDLKITGVAGSGKTLVLLHRAKEIAERHRDEEPTIALITYTNALVKYMNEVKETYPQDIADCIEINTVDSLLFGVYRGIHNISYTPMSYLNNKEDNCVYQVFQEVVKSVRQRLGQENHFLNKSMEDWLMSEITWIKTRSTEIRSREDYLNCKRIGRGITVRPSTKERNIIYDVYSQYYQKVAVASRNDPENFYAELAADDTIIPDGCKYDYILVDECQDLGLSKIKILKRLARKSITCAGDFAQKIYTFAGFKWKEAGINIRGRSIILEETFRNTVEILQLAEDLKRNNQNLASLEDDGDIESERPSRHGPRPIIHALGDSAKEKQQCLCQIKKLKQENSQYRIGLLLPNKDLIDSWRDFLENNQEEYEYIQSGKNHDYEVITPGLKITTYHSSKGIEFDAVLLPELDENIFPSGLDKADEDRRKDIMDEGRSLLYVAITRSKQFVDIYCCNNLFVRPSKLLYEFDKEHYQLEGSLTPIDIDEFFDKLI